MMFRTTMFAVGTLMIAPAALAQTAPASAPAGTAPAAAPAQLGKPVVGGKVFDKAGVELGTVESLTANAAVVTNGTAKVALPLSAIGAGANGPTLSITKAELDAAQAQAQQQAAGAVKAKLVAGTPVTGLQGAALGTIKAADATTVTMTTAKNIDVKLPVTGFGAGPDGGVVLGMTQAQLDAATAGATPAPASAAAGASTTAAATTGAVAPGTSTTTETSTSTTTPAATAKGSTTTKTATKKTTKTRK